jgi:Trypsin-like peptidase domain
MTEPGYLRPPADSWVASVHAGEHDPVPLGSAVVIDRRRALTCAHVILDDDGASRSGQLWVSFPRADLAEDERRAVVSVDLAPGSTADVAVLVLDQDVPVGVEPAPLRQPRPGDVVGKRWWAFGFPDADPIGDCADGHVGAALSWGWLRLDTTSRYLVRPGFSGGGLWPPDYDAVVGVVGQAHANGDGRAITLFRADQSLPLQKLKLLSTWSVQAAGEVALAAWGWSLAADPEGVRHWRPRARGVAVDSERGYRFRGRVRALTEITKWLERPALDRRVLVVTGSPGVGKSAVLGRVVTTADAVIGSLLPASDDGVRAQVGSADGKPNHRDHDLLPDGSQNRTRRWPVGASGEVRAVTW